MGDAAAALRLRASAAHVVWPAAQSTAGFATDALATTVRCQASLLYPSPSPSPNPNPGPNPNQVAAAAAAVAAKEAAAKEAAEAEAAAEARAARD